MNIFTLLLKWQHSTANSRWGGAISSLLHKLLRICFQCDLPSNINFDKIHLCHMGFGIVINPNVSIGEGTYIQHCVTIGVRDDIRSTKAPIIGRNCYIGASATIIGDINIGDNVKIGAGAVVISDIPSNSTAVGVPAKVISHP